MIAPTHETLFGWGMAHHARSWIHRPGTVEEVAEAVAGERRRGRKIAHRGAGLSYGDAALNEGGAIIVCEGLRQIVAFDAQRGSVRAEAGVTIGQLWQHVLPLGWWPPVVPGTSAVTLGGAIAMNVHGKNAFHSGAIGEHVEALTMLDAEGCRREVTATPGPTAPGSQPLRLQDVVGAQGLNGTILDVSLRLKRVSTGYLAVSPLATRDIAETLDRLDEGATSHDYAVGWLDAFAHGRAAGRGSLHFADDLAPDHALAGIGLAAADQHLPDRILGLVPKRHAWRLMTPFTNDPGMWALNAAKYLMGVAQGRRPYLQSHAAFHFLLDYVPDWKNVYRPHGLVQYQFFVPKATARTVLGEALARQHRAGIVSYLAVLKRHRPDAFASQYAVDGYSLALDFPVRPRRAAAFDRLLRDFDALQREVGGRIYAAKDGSSVGRLPAVRHPAFGTDLSRRWEQAQDR